MEHYEDEVVRSDQGRGETFDDVMEARISRRTVLAGGLALGLSTLALGKLADWAPSAPRLSFKPITSPPTGASIVVPEGYQWMPLLRCGDPIFPNATALSPRAQTAEAQRLQSGYNCDFVGFMPLPQGQTSSNRGVLCVNHEYTNPELMFPGYDK